MVLRSLVRYTTLACLALGTFALQAEALTLTREARDKLKRETTYALDALESYHYNRQTISELDSSEILRNYMRELDGSRLFFLQGDEAAQLERFAGPLKKTYLYTGDIFPAFEIYNLYEQRVNARLDWVSLRLKGDFNLATDQTYAPDRSKAGWPVDEAAANDLWERRLKFELIAELLEEQDLTQAKAKIAERYERMRKFLGDIEPYNVQETFVTSIAKLYDPHSDFFSHESAEDFDIVISNSLIGIGAQLREIDGYCTLEKLLPGGPAEMSGLLHPGDKIIAVAQGNKPPVDVVNMKLRKVVQLIRGTPGSEVRLTILPADSTQTKVINLVREKIELTSNLASGGLHEIVEGDRTLRLGVIELPSFYGEGDFGENAISTSRDVEELITQLKARHVDGLVLDLRNNGGGRLDEAIALTGLFIKEGPVVMKKAFNGEIVEDWDRDPKVAYDGPLVVLVSKGSASASEIVAGALKSYGRALVIGDEQTHGKGTVQAPIDLARAFRRPFGTPVQLGTVKVTVQKFYLPDGASTQNAGVHSDISFPSLNEIMLDGERDLERALPWDTIPADTFSRSDFAKDQVRQVDEALIERLRHGSEQRQASLEEFDFLRRNLDWYRQRNKQEEVSLNLRQREQQKLEDTTKRDEIERELEQLSRQNFPFEKVNLALTAKKEAAHQTKLRETPLPDGKPRANRFYQKVYYYQKDAQSPIEEIWVEYFDYEKGLRHADDLTRAFAEASGIELTPGEMTRILTEMKNRDRLKEFSATAPFITVLGERASRDKVERGLPAFYTAMLKADPEVVRDRPRLDVQLRESLRILGDWVVLRSLAEKGEAPALVTTAAPKVAEAAPATK